MKCPNCLTDNMDLVKYKGADHSIYRCSYCGIMSRSLDKINEDVDNKILVDMGEHYFSISTRTHHEASNSCNFTSKLRIDYSNLDSLILHLSKVKEKLMEV